ncbi:SGNH hydrolase-type esterase domain-containing protein, partial [Tanacetum coccineum]
MYDNGTKIGVALEQGMNFAVSGATTLNSSFLEATGIRSLRPDTSLRVQLAWFKQALPAFCANTSDCGKLIGRSLFLVGEIGGNDYNYAIFAGKHIDEIKPIVPIVVDTIVSTINELIEMGAQTLVVPGYFPVGCSSIFLTMSGSQNKDPTTGCLIELNEFVKFHNEALQKKLNQIRVENPDVNIIYADYYNALMQVYRSPDMF